MRRKRGEEGMGGEEDQKEQREWEREVKVAVC